MDMIKVAVIGCGSRGYNAYGRWMKKFSDRIQVVAAADIRKEPLEMMAKAFNLPEDQCFSSGEALLNEDKLADFVFICTPDDCHYSQAVKAIRKGYHLVLEKPISPSTAECARIAQLAKQYDRTVIVCHVLRYTRFYSKLHELATDGTLGEIVAIQALEKIGYWHLAHSYVRGNWHNRMDSAPMLIAKSCHDLDIFVWLTGKKCKAVSAFGSLQHFNEQHAPEGSAERCKDCTVKDCPYNAYHFYLNRLDNGNPGWPVNVVSVDPTREKVIAALDKGPYGKCVYHNDNDVADHYAVNLLMEGGTTVNFTVSGFSGDTGRKMTIMGTKAHIECYDNAKQIRVYPFGGEPYDVDIGTGEEDSFGHSGGDYRLIESLVNSMTGEKYTLRSTAEESVQSHYIALAAEKSRLHGGQLIDMDAYLAEELNY